MNSKIMRNTVCSNAQQYFLVDTRWVEDGMTWETMAFFSNARGKTLYPAYPVTSKRAATEQEATANHCKVVNDLSAETEKLKKRHTI